MCTARHGVGQLCGRATAWSRWVSSRRLSRVRGTSLLIALLLAAPIYAADVGSVRGVVDDPHGHPVALAGVKLKSATSAWVQTTSTDERGEFVFMTVPLGDYVLSVTHADF